MNNNFKFLEYDETGLKPTFNFYYADKCTSSTKAIILKLDDDLLYCNYKDERIYSPSLSSDKYFTHNSKHKLQIQEILDESECKILTLDGFKDRGFGVATFKDIEVYVNNLYLGDGTNILESFEIVKQDTNNATVNIYLKTGIKLKFINKIGGRIKRNGKSLGYIEAETILDENIVITWDNS